MQIDMVCIQLGVPGANRTHDQQLRRLLLYPLSYGNKNIIKILYHKYLINTMLKFVYMVELFIIL